MSFLLRKSLQGLIWQKTRSVCICRCMYACLYSSPRPLFIKLYGSYLSWSLNLIPFQSRNFLERWAISMLFVLQRFTGLSPIVLLGIDGALGAGVGGREDHPSLPWKRILEALGLSHRHTSILHACCEAICPRIDCGATGLK